MSDNDNCSVHDAMIAFVLFTSLDEQEIGRMELCCLGLEIHSIQKKINGLEQRLHEQQISNDDSQQELIGLKAEKIRLERNRRCVKLTGRPLVTMWENAIKEGRPGVPLWALFINEELEKKRQQVHAGTESANQENSLPGNPIIAFFEKIEHNMNELAEENSGIKEERRRLLDEQDRLLEQAKDQTGNLKPDGEAMKKNGRHQGQQPDLLFYGRNLTERLQKGVTDERQRRNRMRNPELVESLLETIGIKLHAVSSERRFLETERFAQGNREARSPNEGSSCELWITRLTEELNRLDTIENRLLLKQERLSATNHNQQSLDNQVISKVDDSSNEDDDSDFR